MVASIYLKDRYPQHDIGDHSYGDLEIIEYVGASARIRIGRYCSFAKRTAVLLGGEHNHGFVSTYPFFPLWGHARPDGFLGHKGDIEIGNDVWVGYGAIILSGVVIGDGAVIAAGATVTSGVKPYTIVGGIPAKHIKNRFEPAAIEQLLKIKWWEWPEARVRVFMSMLQSGDIHRFIEEAKNE